MEAATPAAMRATGRRTSRRRCGSNMRKALAQGAGARRRGARDALAPLLAECEAAADLTTIPTLATRAAYADGAADAEAFGERLERCGRRGARTGGVPRGRAVRPLRRAAALVGAAAHWINPKASMYVGQCRVARGGAGGARRRRRAGAAAARRAVAPAAEAGGGGAQVAPPTASRTPVARPPRPAEPRAAPSGLRSSASRCLVRASSPALATPCAAAADGDADADDAEAAELAEAARRQAAMMAALAQVAADAAVGVVLVGWSMGGCSPPSSRSTSTLRGRRRSSCTSRGGWRGLVRRGGRRRRTFWRPRRYKASAAWKEWLLPLLNADLRADAEPSVASPRRVGGVERWWDGGDGRAAAAVPAAGARATASRSRRRRSTAGGRSRVAASSLTLCAAATTSFSVARWGSFGCSSAPSSRPPLYRVAWAPLAGPAGAGAAAVAPAAAAEPVTLVALDPSLDAAADGALLAALGGAHGLFVRVAAAADLRRSAQCWASPAPCSVWPRRAAAAASCCSARPGGRRPRRRRVEGRTARVPRALRAATPPPRRRRPAPPERAARRAPRRRQGWLSWLSAVPRPIPTRPTSGSPPSAARRPRASAAAAAACSSSTPTVDAAGTYLITGGSGGLGTALVVAPPGAEGAAPPDCSAVAAPPRRPSTASAASPPTSAARRASTRRRRSPP